MDENDNELLVLEITQKLVDAFDDYFINVCELDIIFNFIACHFIKNELICDGFLLNYSDYSVEKHMKNQDFMQLTDYRQEDKVPIQEEKEKDLSTANYDYVEYIMNTPYGYSGVTPFYLRLPRP
jgi:hypothetical protein